MGLPLKKLLIVTTFFMLLLLIAIGFSIGASDVRVIPMRGPIGTVKISPPNGSAAAYRMDFSGQKSICLRNVTTVDVYISSASSIAFSDGFPLFTTGDTICYDLTSGTTIYFYGDGAGAEVRATMSK